MFGSGSGTSGLSSRVDKTKDEDVSDNGEEGRESEIQTRHKSHYPEIRRYNVHVLPVKTTAMEMGGSVLDNRTYTCDTRYTD